MSTIEKNFMYVCSYGSKGKWTIRKVNKVSSKTTKEYTVEGETCTCKGYEHKNKCKHLEMIHGKFQKGSKNLTNVKGKEEEVKKFLSDYVQAHFDAKHQITFREEVGDVQERFDIICEADEKKVLWTPIMTPLKTEEGKGLPVLVRMIFTDEYEKNIGNF